MCHPPEVKVHFSEIRWWWWFSHQVLSDSCDLTVCSPPGSSVLGVFPGKNTGVGSHFLLQVIFPTQGSNLGLTQWRQILYHLSHQGSCQRTIFFSIKGWKSHIYDSTGYLLGIGWHSRGDSNIAPELLK